jgi:cyclase
MLKVRVIPTLLWKDFGLVKGVGFNSWRRVGSVLPAVKVYNTRDVDELVIMDIVASQQQTAPEHDSVSDFSDECFVPLTVGGGITDLDQISKLLHAGADKVLINTSAYLNPDLINQSALRFGAQCIVVGIDAKLVDGKYICCSHAGSTPTEKSLVAWAKELADRGAGEIIITSIERDGTMQGYDLKLIESVVNAVDIPVIASGVAGTYEHLCQAVQEAGASAVAAASMFHFTEQTPSGAKAALSAAGIPVRKTYASQEPVPCQ